MEKFHYDRRKILLELIPLGIMIVSFAIALYVYPLLPQSIPIHWDAYGQADNFGHKSNIFALPFVFLATLLLFFVLPLIPALSYNMEQVYRQYYYFKIVFSVFFLSLFILTLLPNFGYNVQIANSMLFMIGMLFIALGLFLPRIKKNYIMGIRTPWTIASDLVWTKTHRVGGRLFVISGLIMCGLVFFIRTEWLFYLFIVEIIILSLGLVLYSYVLHRKLPKDSTD